MQIIDLPSVAPGSGFFILSRVKNAEGDYATPADFESIVVRVDNEDAGALVETDTPEVAEVVLDSLQVDGRWLDECGQLRDRLGYNFAYPTLATQTPLADTNYLFKIQYNPVSGQPFYDYYRVKTLSPTFSG